MRSDGVSHELLHQRQTRLGQERRTCQFLSMDDGKAMAGTPRSSASIRSGAVDGERVSSWVVDGFRAREEEGAHADGRA